MSRGPRAITQCSAYRRDARVPRHPDPLDAHAAWARAVDQRLGDEFDGLYGLSSITGEPVVTLFSRTERLPAFPPRPRFHALLSDATADPVLQLAVEELSYSAL